MPSFPLRQGVSDVRNAACPIRPASTCVANQPTTTAFCIPVHACKRREETYSFLCFSLDVLMAVCDCAPSVDLGLVLSVEVVASLYSTRSALSSHFRYHQAISRRKPRGITPVSLQPPGYRNCVRLFTHLSSSREIA